jgi:hypothetical protein
MLRRAGMLPTTAAQALLELVRTADAPGFKPLQALIEEGGCCSLAQRFCSIFLP